MFESGRRRPYRLLAGWFFALFLILHSLPSVAQAVPDTSNEPTEDRAEIFAGYQGMRLSTNFQGSNYSLSANGWNASITGYFTDHIGATFDFGGQYGSIGNAGADFYSFLFGPTYRTKLKGLGSRNMNVVAHALYGSTRGMSHETPGIFAASGTVSQFTMEYGGGLDIPYKTHLSIRPVEVDYIWMHQTVDRLGVTTNGFRYTAGVVFHF